MSSLDRYVVELHVYPSDGGADINALQRMADDAGIVSQQTFRREPTFDERVRGVCDVWGISGVKVRTKGNDNENSTRDDSGDAGG